jgi:hypothetical protein
MPSENDCPPRRGVTKASWQIAEEREVTPDGSIMEHHQLSSIVEHPTWPPAIAYHAVVDIRLRYKSDRRPYPHAFLGTRRIRTDPPAEEVGELCGVVYVAGKNKALLKFSLRRTPVVLGAAQRNTGAVTRMNPSCPRLQLEKDRDIRSQRAREVGETKGYCRLEGGRDQPLSTLLRRTDAKHHHKHPARSSSRAASPRYP